MLQGMCCHKNQTVYLHITENIQAIVYMDNCIVNKMAIEFGPERMNLKRTSGEDRVRMPT